jgi:beta-lactamase regulating signal transducer with metallopeptidase domain
MMLAHLADAALRSAALAAVARLGVVLLRLRQPQLQMTVWTAVLVVAMAMPGLTPWMRLMVPADRMPAPLLPIAATDAAVTDAVASAAAAIGTAPAASETDAAPAVLDHSPLAALDWRSLATGVYAVIAGVMLLRVLIGLLLMEQVRRAARRVGDDWALGGDVRVSEVVRAPVTFASTILLPAACATWNPGKRQTALLHERSHVAQGDFYVLLLAQIYRALFWFNPLAWWLPARLADLAEMIGDDAALAGPGDRRSYAELLVDLSTIEQRLPAGVAIARPGTVRRRVARILAAPAPSAPVPVPVPRRRRWLIATAFVPLTALSAGTIARSAPAVATRLDRYVGQFQFGVKSILTVTREGDQLFAQSTGEPKQRLIAIGDGEFVMESGRMTATFTLRNGSEAKVELREGGKYQSGVRADATRAAAIESEVRRLRAAAPERFKNQTPMAGSDMALRRTIEDLRYELTGEGMSPPLAALLRPKLAMYHRALDALGAVETVSFKGVGRGGFDIYGVKFARGSAEFRIDLAPDGTTEDLVFRADGDGTAGAVFPCALEPGLRPLPDAAPISETLVNRSGGTLGVFQLDGAGRRVSLQFVEDGRSMYLLTKVARPLVIADPAGQCREIVLPGRTTQSHVLEPLRPAEPRDPSTGHRATPMPGSDQALLR